MNKLIVGLLIVAGMLCVCSASQAGVISSGGYDVGIVPTGELYEDSSGIGFRRNGDGYDPIRPGTPRDSWGVSAGTTAGWANHEDFGIVNLVANGPAVFGAGSAFISTFLNDGSGNLLQIDQSYSFAAANVLKIATTVTNVSGSTQAVGFSRNVDFDVDPTAFSEITNVDPLSGQVVASSYGGFENPNPLTGFASPAGPAGGVFGPSDLGAAYQLDLGSLAAGASSFFDVFYALSADGETPSALRSQLYGLGATFVITSESSDHGTNSAAVAYGPAVPEPCTLAIWSLLGVCGVGAGWRRRK